MTDIRETGERDIADILRVIREAFGSEEEAELTRGLLADPSAKPRLSLIAEADGRAVGHILFIRAAIEGSDCGASLLAPLSVIPDAQSGGIGGRLMADGLRRLTARGVDLVFVLGHPGYYPRHGFEPAGQHGLDAPYPIPEEHADAWMVQALRPGLLGEVRGTLRCADALDEEMYWVE